MPSPLYIDRPSVQRFQDKLAEALRQPEINPTIFHLHGMGGVGKTTLTKRIQDRFDAGYLRARVSFGETTGIDTPIGLLRQLYQQIEQDRQTKIRVSRPKQGNTTTDPFADLDGQYRAILDRLETESVDGQGKPTADQMKLVKEIVSGTVQFGASQLLKLPDAAAEAAGALASEAVVGGSVAVLSGKDRVVELLNRHPATHSARAARELVLQGELKLTEAFVRTMAVWAAQHPVLLILDTFEKAPQQIGNWLGSGVLGNTDCAQQPIAWVVAGRHSLLSQELWRKLQQDQDCVYECELDRFDQEQTRAYLQHLGIDQPQEIEVIWQQTRGLPYFLNEIRRKRTEGKAIDYSTLRQDVLSLLLQQPDLHLKRRMQQVVEWLACCRCFNQAVVQWLLQQFQVDFEAAPEEQLNWFEWLKQQHFVEFAQGQWRLDDVARNVFQQALGKDQPQEFRRTHDLLARYYQSQSNHQVPPTAPPSHRYTNPDWRSVRADYLYHTALSGKPFDLICRTHLLEARYFGVDDLLREPVNILWNESRLDSQAFHPLPFATRQFLKRLQPAIDYGAILLDADAIDYSDCQTRLGLSRSTIETALRTALQPLDLTGLAKFMALYCQAQRSPADPKIVWLQQAQTQATTLITPNDPEFSRDLLVYWVGNALFALGHKEAAIACYDQALAIQPDYSKALNNKGTALSALGHKEAAIACYDQALAIQPDDSAALYNKGNALSDLGQNEAAIACYDQALAIQPDDSQALYNKACCYALMAEGDRAIEELQRAIELDQTCREQARTDTDFDGLRQEERFQNLVAGNPA
jgi:tetratricopeptide (TPR) repeat protein